MHRVRFRKLPKQSNFAAHQNQILSSQIRLMTKKRIAILLNASRDDSV